MEAGTETHWEIMTRLLLPPTLDSRGFHPSKGVRGFNFKKYKILTKETLSLLKSIKRYLGNSVQPRPHDAKMS